MAATSEKGGDSPPPEESDVEQGEKYSEKTEDRRPCCFKYGFIFIKVWSIFTLCAIWYLSVTLIQHHYQAKVSLIFTQYYAIGMTIFVTIFELIWVISKCVCCKDDGNCCCTVWRIFIWFNNWKKGLLYIAIAIPTFVEGDKALLGIICGVLVIVLGFLYILKTIGQSDCIQKQKYTKTRYVEVTSPKAKLVSHEVQMDSSSSETKPAEKNYKSTEMEEKKPSNETNGESPKSAESSTIDERAKSKKGLNPFDDEDSAEELDNK